MFNLSKVDNWTIAAIEDLPVFERDIYVTLQEQYIKEQEEADKNANSSM